LFNKDNKYLQNFHIIHIFISLKNYSFSTLDENRSLKNLKRNRKICIQSFLFKMQYEFFNFDNYKKMATIKKHVIFFFNAECISI